MKRLILTAVLAVALIGGAATVATFDDGDTSDGTVAVGTTDIGSALVAPTLDANTAHQQAELSFFDRSPGVPVSASVIARIFANATLNEPVDDFKRRLSQHFGKSLAYVDQANCGACHVPSASVAHVYPLRC